MSDVDEKYVRFIALDLLAEVTSASRAHLERRAAWHEGRWIDRALGDSPSDDLWSELSVDACLFMVRTVRSARRMRDLELREMAIAAVSA
ncbi:hypothetical protein LGT39_06335 [Demequina sp. TTPB684]|uniref:hypothetical protein n=1 Tax=unclassified Demequina TaxID=2620311 RepID=UPI001CF558FC|nr:MULTISPECIES: hypothetical protein [unclassified Demequina]MCB2412467.1 hypothetical protein [Demequina sp. TTPB684]UPU87700.1 hypothetical protein LGT36_010610 [Demequina sp. TMPB413]